MIISATIIKRYVSLIEVLIAICLTATILMTLTFFYQQVTQMGIEVDQISSNNFNMRYIETRLAAILPKAISETDKKNDFVFFSVGDEGITKPGSQSLIFTYDNQVNLDKSFSGHVLGRIYLDNKGNLAIAYWPSPKRWENEENPPIKKEVLLQGVENLAFEFYVAPLTKQKQSLAPQENITTEKKPLQEQKMTEPEPQGEWRPQPWLQDYKQLPVMVKLIVTMPKGQEPLIFIYPLANGKRHIIYE